MREHIAKDMYVFFITQKYHQPYGTLLLKYAVNGYVNRQRIFILINMY